MALFDTRAAVARFAADFARDDVPVELLALDIARLVDPELESDAVLLEIAELAAAVNGRWRPLAGRAGADRFLAIFNQELGFAGSRADYYDPRNSMLDQLLRRRTGLPITLCVLCMALGRRLGLDIQGVGFPNHFMASYRADGGIWLLDPFHGVVVEMTEAEEYLGRMFWPVTPQVIALRMLNNLRNTFLRQRRTAMALRVTTFLVQVQPHDPQLWRERGLLHHQLDAWDESLHDFRRYFFLRGLLPHLWRAGMNELFTASDLPVIGLEDRRLLAMAEETRKQLVRNN
jgi:regulator of sirC expression with transglutaminase-like and TPR domain